jgi:hypothetical protein
MLDAAMYVVLFRTFSVGKELLLKARPSGWTEEDLPRPVKGERPIICNSLLSKVDIVRDIPGGYDIATQNSRYQALLMTGEEFRKMLLEGSWALDRISRSGSLYYRKV